MQVSSSQTKKPLGFWMLFSLVVGNIIGAGIFLLPSSLAQYGGISLISWVITIAGFLCLAFVFSDLNRMLPITGGPFLYTREAFGNLWGFVVAYTYWVAWCVGNASMAIAIPGYLAALFPILKASEYQPWLNFLIESISIWLIIGINLCGIKTVGRTQILTTILKVTPLLVIIFVGLFKVNWHTVTENFIPAGTTAPIYPLLGAMTVMLYALIGFESSTIPADDAKSSRVVSKATILGTLFAGLLYILCTFTLMGLLPLNELKQSASPFADAASLLFGSGAAHIITLCALIAIMGALNGSVLVQVLDSVAASRFNLGPKNFTYLNKNNVAYMAFISAGIVITVLLALTKHKTLMEQFNFIVVLTTLAFVIPYLICCMAEIVMVMRNKQRYTKKTLAKILTITFLATIYSIWTIAGAGKNTIIYGALFFVSAFPIYGIFIWIKRSRTTKESALDLDAVSSIES